MPLDPLLAEIPAEADRQLIRSIGAGSAEALADLYDRYAATVFGLAKRITGRVEDAEEVVQDVFAQVWRQATRYEGPRATVAGWIVMLTRTRAIDRLRARSARPDLAAGMDPNAMAPLHAEGPDPEQIALGAEDARGVHDALRRLPEAQRSLVELAYYDGLTHAQIAARTGIPLGTVKTRLRTAMMTMRDALVSKS